MASRYPNEVIRTNEQAHDGVEVGPEGTGVMVVYDGEIQFPICKTDDGPTRVGGACVNPSTGKIQIRDASGVRDL